MNIYEVLGVMFFGVTIFAAFGIIFDNHKTAERNSKTREKCWDKHKKEILYKTERND